MVPLHLCSGLSAYCNLWVEYKSNAIFVPPNVYYCYYCTDPRICASYERVIPVLTNYLHEYLQEEDASAPQLLHLLQMLRVTCLASYRTVLDAVCLAPLREKGWESRRVAEHLQRRLNTSLRCVAGYCAVNVRPIYFQCTADMLPMYGQYTANVPPICCQCMANTVLRILNTSAMLLLFLACLSSHFFRAYPGCVRYLRIL